MPESGLPANKIDELRRRFEEQPASRVFLQLAEEYRRLGLPEQAVEVLEAGLAKRPGDLSGMVALGRCRLELGNLEGAVEILDGVIARDAAHLVANKLLIEAHLQQGDAERAGQRLDLYKLLNDRDPEIDDLETRLRALRRGAREAAEASVNEAPPFGAEIPLDDPFAAGLGAAQHVEPPPAPEPVFTPEPLPVTPIAPTPAVAMALPFEGNGAIFALDPLPIVDLDALWQASAARPRTLHRRVEPFGPLPLPSIGDVRTMLTAGVVFPSLMPAEALPSELPAIEIPAAAEPSHVEPLAEEPPEVMKRYEPVEATVEVSAADVLASRPPAPLFEETFENEPATVSIDLPEPIELPPAMRSEPLVARSFYEEAVIEEPAIEEPPVKEPPAEEPPVEEAVIEEPAIEEPVPTPPEPEPEIPVATVTLAELYLAQGHVAEARRIFAEVLGRDPHNLLARAALARLEPPVHQRLTAGHLLAVLPVGEVPQGLTAKKVLVLSAYTQRLRRRHVR